jgi:hypothetical protein
VVRVRLAATRGRRPRPERWQAQWAPASASRPGNGLILIDADTSDKAHAALIQQCVTNKLGVLPTRIGNFPKAGYLVRVSEPIRYCRIDFGPLTERNQPRDRVEILSDGRQFVAHGIHPKTKAPYVWPIPLAPLNDLPMVTPAQIVALLEELRSILPASKPIVTEGSHDTVSQASLRGDIDTIRKAVISTPNNSKAFPTRESYRDFGYAIKAACRTTSATRSTSSRSGAPLGKTARTTLVSSKPIGAGCGHRSAAARNGFTSWPSSTIQISSSAQMRGSRKFQMNRKVYLSKVPHAF